MPGRRMQKKPSLTLATDAQCAVDMAHATLATRRHWSKPSACLNHNSWRTHSGAPPFN
ncbi:hypothetical protein QJS10_CPA02g00895 [Acorus calamus]|uniref:Uncharacterized protein n=1 Tax=Acorus calamus TaxID=4465 RepID=A0AAV9FCP2_ACOCL|nr:hypothetical protein QJS10_CPA02g00895 [Acorus calamus]